LLSFLATNPSSSNPSFLVLQFVLEHASLLLHSLQLFLQAIVAIIFSVLVIICLSCFFYHLLGGDDFFLQAGKLGGIFLELMGIV